MNIDTELLKHLMKKQSIKLQLKIEELLKIAGIQKQYYYFCLSKSYMWVNTIRKLRKIGIDVSTIITEIQKSNYII